MSWLEKKLSEIKADREKEAAEEYFTNLPFNEGTLRDVIGGLKESGYFGKKEFDPKTIDLSEVIAPPTQRMGGVRIIGLTEGGNKHKPQHMFVRDEYDVPNNEVYVTIDDTAPLAGKVATYKFEKTEEGLRLKGADIHARS